MSSLLYLHRYDTDLILLILLFGRCSILGVVWVDLRAVRFDDGQALLVPEKDTEMKAMNTVESKLYKNTNTAES